MDQPLLVGQFCQFTGCRHDDLPKTIHAQGKRERKRERERERERERGGSKQAMLSVLLYDDDKINEFK